MIVVNAQSHDSIKMIRNLFREYENFLKVDLCFQAFEKELAELPGKYSPPDGALLLALDAGHAVGCVALRKLEDGICEMKRLYVKEEYRGKGLGKFLAERIIATARNMGYLVMRLDTLETLSEAMGLYQSLGFSKTDPYYDNPLSGVVYWELPLGAGLR